jgi:hypothetical protein
MKRASEKTNFEIGLENIRIWILKSEISNIFYKSNQERRSWTTGDLSLKFGFGKMENW